MEFDDFFGNKQRDRRFDNHHRYQDDQSHNYRHPYQRHNSNFKLEYFLEKLRNNRKIKGLIIFAAIVILAIVIGLIAILLPLILKLLDFFSQNGVQGLMDYATEFLDKLLKGTGK